jgi:hypothetical protein
MPENRSTRRNVFSRRRVIKLPDWRVVVDRTLVKRQSLRLLTTLHSPASCLEALTRVACRYCRGRVLLGTIDPRQARRPSS